MSTAEPAVTTRKTRDLPAESPLLNIEHVYDAKNAEYRFEIDAAGRKIRETYPPDASNTARFVYWHYDRAGNVDQYYDPAGYIQTMGYDNRDRLTVAWWSGGDGIPRTYTNDAASRMTKAVTGVNETTVAFGYDDANRKVWEDQTVAGYLTRGVVTPRDGDGNPTKLEIFTNGVSTYRVSYDYTQRNQLSHIYQAFGGVFFSYTYDPAGNILKRKDEWGRGQ